MNGGYQVTLPCTLELQTAEIDFKLNQIKIRASILVRNEYAPNSPQVWINMPMSVTTRQALKNELEQRTGEVLEARERYNGES